MPQMRLTPLPPSAARSPRAPIDYDRYRADAAEARAATVRNWIRIGLRGAARLLARPTARRRSPPVRTYRSREVF